MAIHLARVLRRDRQRRRRNGARGRQNANAVIVTSIAVADAVAATGHQGAGPNAQHILAGKGLGQGSTQGVACLQTCDRGHTHGTGGAVVNARIGHSVHGQRARRDVGTGLVGTHRRCCCGKQIVAQVRKSRCIRDGFVRTHVSGVKIGPADQPQTHRRRCIGHIGQQTTDCGRCGAVVDLVVTQAKHPSFGIERTATRQVIGISQDFAAGAGVIHRVKSDTQLPRGHGQTIAATSDGHGASCCTGPSAIVVSTQHHVPCCDRRCCIHRDVAPCHRLQVAGGDGGGRVDVDVLCCGKSQLTRGRGDGRAHIHIASSVQCQAAVGTGDGLVHIHITGSVQGERGGCGPGQHRIDVDVTQARTAQACVGGAHRDVAATQGGHQIGHIDVGGADRRVR